MKSDPVWEARVRFNPLKLCSYLARRDGYAVVDKEKAIQFKDDDRLFHVILHFDYRWNFKDYEDTTIYFAVENEQIYGGVFNLANNQPLTRRQIVTAPHGGTSCTYKLTPKEYITVYESINNA